MLTFFLQAVLVYAIPYFLWKFLGQLFINSPLDNLPGPPSQSFLFGDFFESSIPRNRLLIIYPISTARRFSTILQYQRMGISQRNYTEMYDYLFDLFQTGYWRLADGSVIKIKALLGVCAVLFWSPTSILIAAFRKINFSSSTRKHCTI